MKIDFTGGGGVSLPLSPTANYCFTIFTAGGFQVPSMIETCGGS